MNNEYEPTRVLANIYLYIDALDSIMLDTIDDLRKKGLYLHHEDARRWKAMVEAAKDLRRKMKWATKPLYETEVADLFAFGSDDWSEVFRDLMVKVSDESDAMIKLKSTLKLFKDVDTKVKKS